MKFLVVLSCLLAVTYGIPPEIVEQFKEKLLQYAIGCKSEVGATSDDIEPMFTNQSPTTETGKCFLACMHKKMGFMNAAGQMDKDGSYAVIEKVKPLDDVLYGKLMKIGATCLAEVVEGPNECETATNMYGCVKREEKALGVQSFNFKP